jgi:hypothetical protein
VEVVSNLCGSDSELAGKLLAGSFVTTVVEREVADRELGEVVFAYSCVAGSAVVDALEVCPLLIWHWRGAAAGGFVEPIALGEELFCAGGEDLLGAE